jgi:ribosome-associated protein
MTDPTTHLAIDDALAIPRAELEYRASRSGGPGGQHVNTSSTRIELWWDVAGSPSLDEAQRERLLVKLATRLDGAGRLRLVSGGSRSQLQNRDEVTERFRALVAQALRVPKPRKRTKPTRASKERRLQAKRRRGDVKRNRGRIEPE